MNAKSLPLEIDTTPSQVDQFYAAGEVDCSLNIYVAWNEVYFELTL